MDWDRPRTTSGAIPLAARLAAPTPLSPTIPALMRISGSSHRENRTDPAMERQQPASGGATMHWDSRSGALCRALSLQGSHEEWMSAQIVDGRLEDQRRCIEACISRRPQAAFVHTGAPAASREGG